LGLRAPPETAPLQPHKPGKAATATPEKVTFLTGAKSDFSNLTGAKSDFF
jgi:hypothetical protein